jgi:hypothetical protein
LIDEAGEAVGCLGGEHTGKERDEMKRRWAEDRVFGIGSAGA